MKNIELKAKYPNLAHAEQLAVELGAKLEWHRKQIDTYFNVKSGRLKLREVENETAELIAYFRENIPQSRESRYQRLTISNSDEMKSMLSQVLGVTIVVSKFRKLYLYKNIRLHLDEVEGLGNFIEFEGVLHPGESESETRNDLYILQNRFEIRKIDLVSVSYSNLLSQR